ncbi:MerR family transcriptional regulator [Acuticoccus mangrovi]|uniref:Helix-turn-helix domain-containing protein n=1 Tax=Acuticoccus mangrovi TaxID=2796142 RepID=A0A934IM49_9HYPH|nr:helix-turn-helix domain-containing protein [Acuticoccus mangrovi]MBJ3776357.1 helix-turn-helix domain-containing protein [Acuticoccus mangrovi]
MSHPLTIGDLAREVGIKVQTVRYYEQIGILPEPARTTGNQRRYDEAARRRLVFIRHARQLGFPLEAVRELLALADQPDQPCDRVDEIARRQLEAVDERLRRLTALRRSLAGMIEACGTGSVADCRIVETLADHGLCAEEHPDPDAARIG